MSHRGIELRIRLPLLPDDQQVALLADSDALHFMAKYGAAAERATPDWHVKPEGWYVLFPLVSMDSAGAMREVVYVEARAVELPDEYPDPEES